MTTPTVTESVMIPTVGGLKRGVTRYAIGVGAGLVYRVISQISGSGLIGGAVSAGVTSAIFKGSTGEVVAIVSGFQTGREGIEGVLGAWPESLGIDLPTLPDLSLPSFFGGKKKAATLEQTALPDQFTEVW